MIASRKTHYGSNISLNSAAAFTNALPAKFDSKVPSGLPSAYIPFSKTGSPIQHYLSSRRGRFNSYSTGYSDDCLEKHSVRAILPVASSSSKESASVSGNRLFQFLAWIHQLFTYLWSTYFKRVTLPASKSKKAPFVSTHLDGWLPPIHNLTIPLHGCVMMEIEGCISRSERFGDVEYQIYRRQDLTQDDIKADILYLPDTPLNGAVNVSPLMATFIHTGHRVIIPHIDKHNKLHAKSTDPSFDVGQRARLVALVLQSVSFKDQKFEKEKFNQPGPNSLGLGNTPPVRPTFLLGLGHNSLVALSYPVEICQSINLSDPLGLSGDLSIASCSARAEPLRMLMEKLIRMYQSVRSGIRGLGRFSRDPTGAIEDSEALIALGSLPEIHGIIAIGPTLDAKNVGANKKGIRQTFQPGGSVNYSPNISNAIQKLHENAYKIKIPVLIAHSTKEAYGVIDGIHTLYGALASSESALIFCPTLCQSGNLAADLARNGLANDCLMWIWERIHSRDLKGNPAQETNPQAGPGAAYTGSYDSGSSRSSFLTDIFSGDGPSTTFGEEKYLEDSVDGHAMARFGGPEFGRNSAWIPVLPNFLDTLFVQIEVNLEDGFERTSIFDSPYSASSSATVLPGTPSSSEFSCFRSSSIKIKAHPGPRGVVSVAGSDRASIHSLCCVEMPKSFTLDMRSDGDQADPPLWDY